VLALIPLAACTGASKSATAPVLAPAASGATQRHQAVTAAYERGFLAGRRYQAKLDGERPLPACAPAANVAPAAPAPLTPATPVPPAASTASSYSPSGPARPINLP
jgi:hypothetical protein